MLVARAISKSFGALVALRDVNLSVAPSSIHGLIGPNGAGKTTLINVLTGYIRPDHGSVSLGTLNLDRLPPHKRARLGISRSFQSPRLLEDLSVAVNIDLGQQHLGQAKRSKPGEIAEMLELNVDLAQPIGTLSAGQRRLAELARSIVGRPSVLLLDEPFAGLTGAEIGKIAAAIRRLTREFDLAVLLIEHNLAEVFAIADEVSVMDRGAIIAAGPAASIATAPEVRSVFFGGDTSLGTAKSQEDDLSSAETALHVGALAAGYGRLEILHGVDIVVKRREIVGLIGVNGAGKSTLLRALAGTARVSAGTVTLQGQPAKIGNTPLLVRSGLVLVPEGRHLFTSLSAEDNLRLAGAAAGLREADIVQRLRFVYEMLPQVFGFRANPAGSLSGGQQQSVSIARALMCKPSVLLLDEPSIGLSRAALESLAPQLLGLVREEGLSILLAEQNLSFAAMLCDRSYLLDGGKIVASGKADVIASAWDHANVRNPSPAAAARREARLTTVPDFHQTSTSMAINDAKPGG